jgi:uncharacterized membrane protein YdbT with pleckstrin-like domain
MRIFGREPAVLAGVIEAAIMVAVAVGIVHWDAEQIGSIMAVVTIVFGIIVAYLTHDVLLGLFTGLIKAGGALLIAFGLSVNPDVTATLTALVVALAALFQRTQTSPDRGWATG